MAPRQPTTAPEPGPASEPERLQKVLARAGFGSRRACEQLIAAGRVTVNGVVATLGGRAGPSDRVEVDGGRIPVDPGVRYYALNKPRGVVTTASDPQGRKTVASFYPEGPRVFPVGRLDRDSEGLLLLTNDGELANRLTHPRFGAEKEYLAEVEGSPTDSVISQLTRGVELEDGMARAASARKVAVAKGRVAVRIVMTEGRKREVRRMLEAIGLEVSRLVRVRVGPIGLGALAPGEVRPLETSEVQALYLHTAG